MKPDKCIRCNNIKFEEEDIEAETVDDDIAYSLYFCEVCGLCYNGWSREWYQNFTMGHDIEYADIYNP